MKKKQKKRLQWYKYNDKKARENQKLELTG